MNYSALKAAINAAIKTNGNKEITGAVLNTVLNAMTTALGEGYQYAGAATPSGTPTSTDGRVFYLANGAGTYTNYGGLVVNAGELALLRYDTEWHKDSVSVGSEQVQSDWTESDSTKKSFIKNKPDLKAVATSGSYNDLTGKPAIPAKTSDLENDENFVSSADLSAVATTGSYDDLYDKPTIPADKVYIAAYDSEDPSACTPYADILAAYNAGKMIFVNEISGGDHIFYNLQWALEGEFVFVSVGTESYGDVYILSVSSDDDWSNDVAEFALKSSIPAAQIQSDWNQNDSSKKDFIKNKPSLKAVATSGSYNDLTGKPAIPAKTSDLENDENFVSSADLSAVATTGSYEDLYDKPTIPEDKVYIANPRCSGDEVGLAWSEGKMCFFKASDSRIYSLAYCRYDEEEGLCEVEFASADHGYIYLVSYNQDRGSWDYNSYRIPTIATSITSSSTNSEAAGAKAVYDFGETKQPKTTSEVLTYQASQTYTLTANKIATLDASAAASGDTITINLPASPAVTDCFDIQITIGANAPTINWPSGISWLGGSAPTINASKKYEINIMNGFAVAGEF